MRSYGVRTYSGNVYGPYSLEEARRVAETVEQPNSVIVLEASAGEGRKRETDKTARVLAWIALALLVFGALTGGGPKTMVELLFKPDSYASLDAQVADPGHGGLYATKSPSQQRLEARFDAWISAIFGMVPFLIATILLIVALVRLERRLTPPLAVACLFWLYLLVWTIVTFSGDSMQLGHTMFVHFWEWS